MAGLDETWSGSQLEEPGPSKTTSGYPHNTAADENEEDSDSDMSDIIPQYDGANDEAGKNILYVTIVNMFTKFSCSSLRFALEFKVIVDDCYCN